MKDCNNCLASVNEDAKICPYCGASMQNCKATVNQEPKEKSKNQEPKEKSKFVLPKTDCSVCFASINASEKKCPCCGTPRNIYNQILPKNAKNLSPVYRFNQQKPVYNRSQSASSAAPGSFWLGFFLTWLGVLIAIFHIQGVESIKNAVKGMIVSHIIAFILFMLFFSL